MNTSNRIILEPKSTKRRLLYSDRCMQNAIKAAQEGMSIRSAATKFNVPKTTLFDKLSGRSPEVTKMGRGTVLSPSEEKLIVDWILKCKRRGMSPSKADILNSIQNLISKDKNRKTPFTNNRPGKTWLQLFLSRHPIINIKSEDKSQKVEESVRNWFQGLEEQMTEMGTLDIFKDPCRVFSCDESNIDHCSKTGQVIGPKDWKNVYDLPPGPDKSTMSFLRTLSANGDVVCPALIYPYLRIPSDILNCAPEELYIGTSETGWVKSDTFIKFLEDGFLPWLKKNEVLKPVVLFVNGKTTHLTVQLCEFCEGNGIILYLFPPNTASILQPAKVGEFKLFKRHWNDVVTAFQLENPSSLVRRIDVAPLLSNLLSQIDRASIINSFISTGLFPMNPQAINFTRISKKPREVKPTDYLDIVSNVPYVDQMSKYQIARSVLIELLPKSKISQARRNKGDKLLAELWSRLNTKIYYESKRVEDIQVFSTVVKEVNHDDGTTEVIVPVDTSEVIANSLTPTVELDTETGTQYSYVILNQ